jgi:hypothetical protein
MATAKLIKSKSDNGGNTFDLSFKKMTTGELMALTRALCYYNSPISNDVLAYIQNSIYTLKDAELSQTIEYNIKMVDPA